MAKKVTPESLFDLTSVTAPVAVSDGSVLYIETTISEEKNQYQETLYRYIPETKKNVAYGAEGHRYGKLMLAPNEEFLSYLTAEDEKMVLYLQPLTGGRPVPLEDETGSVTDYIWSKDSQHLYYWIQEKTKEEEEADADRVTPTRSTQLMHKRDGASFVKEGQVYHLKRHSVISPEKEADILYTTDKTFTLAEITSDEKSIYLTGARNLDDDWDWGASIYRLNLNEGTLTNFTNELLEDGRFYDLVLSPNEKDALLLGNDFSHAFVTLDNLYHYHFGEEKLVNLTADLDYDLGDAVVDDAQQNVQAYPTVHWLSEEDYLVRVAYQSGSAIYHGQVHGDIKEVFRDSVRLTGISWPDTPDLSQKIWVTYSTFTQPSQLGQIDLRAGKLIPIYNPNEAFERTYQIVDPERFWGETDDHVRVQGWYLPPVDSEEKHPAVLNIHGGPQVNFGETFFHEMQVLASSGYGVIMLNPRGGNGYGQEFVASILGAYGTVDYHDLMAGLDDVLDRHSEIDRDRVYVTGGSYGGFMTNWIVTHTDRFRAAVTQRSICNWISFYGTSDIGPHFVEYQLHRNLSDVEGLWDLSPLAHANRLNTPLLVLHGQEDHRCPLEQGEQMYRAALKAGVDTELITFPGSSHGLSRTGLPHLRIQRLNALLDWFDRHQ